MKIQILVRLTLFILVAMSAVYAAPGDFEMVKFISTRNSLCFSLFYFLNVSHTPRDGDNLLSLFLKTNYKKNNLNYFVPFSG